MDNKLKVLWFCNVVFSEKKSDATGSWLHAMASALVCSEKIQLYNISQARVISATRQDYNSIGQWLVPYESLKNGLPSSKTILEIQKIVDYIKPDIIQIWGTENYWGLLSGRGYIKGNIILEIQGLKFEYERYFYSGLSFLDILKCFGIREFVKPWVSLIGLKRSFRRWGILEKEILMNHRNISTQSNWVRAYVRSVNPRAEILNTLISLREEFVEATKWKKESCKPYQIFTSTSSVLSYKGLHVLIEAVSILQNNNSKVRLVIAGAVSSGIRQDGYTRWLKRKIKHLGIEGNIDWLGSLDAKNLVLQMHLANVVVVPSFIETYCLALDEALTIGVPTVVSFSGAMPELAIHEKTALFFPPGDAVMCANAIDRFFENDEYAMTISQNAYNLNKIKNKADIAKMQQSIYSNVLRSND